MWHEARKQERKIRGMLVDYRRRAERRQDFYEKIVSFSWVSYFVCLFSFGATCCVSQVQQFSINETTFRYLNYSSLFEFLCVCGSKDRIVTLFFALNFLQKADPTQFMQIHGRKCKIHLDPAIAAAGESPAVMQVIFDVFFSVFINSEIGNSSPVAGIKSTSTESNKNFILGCRGKGKSIISSIVLMVELIWTLTAYRWCRKWRKPKKYQPMKGIRTTSVIGFWRKMIF